MAKTQNDKIKARLKAGKRINPLQALRWYGCFRLASRINDLKNDGMKINKEMKTSKNDESVRYAEYFLTLK